MPSDADRFPSDRLLRRHGWQIDSRPPGAEARWRKGGLVLGESQALATLPVADLDAARGRGAAVPSLN